MKKIYTSILTIFVIYLSVAQESDSSNFSASIPFTLKLYTPDQYASILKRFAHGDSILNADRIIAVAHDTIDNQINVFTLSNDGLPRRHVLGILPPAMQSDMDNQQGRTWFIVWSTAKSSFIYPSAFTTIFDNNDGTVAAGASLLSIGATLFGTYGFTRNIPLGYGRVGLMNLGSTMAYAYAHQIGTFLNNATSIDNSDPPDDFFIEEDLASDKVRAWLSMGLFPLGMIAGGATNIIDKDDYGSAATIGYFTQTAMGLGYALPLFFVNASDDNRDYLAISSMFSMLLPPAGFYTGYALSKEMKISSGRGTLLYIMGTLGTVSGLLLPTLFEPSLSELQTQRLYSSSAIVGYGLGTWLALRINPQADYSFWQAVFMGASSVGGSLIATAIPLLAKANAHQAYTTAVIGGAWGGLFIGERLSHELFERSSKDKNAAQLLINAPGIISAVQNLQHRSSKSNIKEIPIVTLVLPF